MNGFLLTTRLQTSAIADYDDFHRSVPEGVEAAIRSTGIDDWTIWRRGQMLHQLIVCRDLAQLEDATARQPEAWAGQMRSLVDPSFPARSPQPVRVPWRLRSK